VEGFATLCRPNSKNGKTGLKLSLIEALKNGKNGDRPVGHRSVEWHSGLYLQQNGYRPGGSLAEGCRQKAVGPKSSTTEDTKGHRGANPKNLNVLNGSGTNGWDMLGCIRVSALES
jgi:hypothetical protein